MVPDCIIKRSLNGYDIKVLNELPNLSVLDMENVNLEIMPAHAFRGKTSLTSIVMPKTLKTIEYEAFVASGLTGNLIIPESVTTIGYAAFSDCSGLTNIYCKSPVPPQISEGVFPWTLSTTLYVPTNCA